MKSFNISLISKLFFAVSIIALSSCKKEISEPQVTVLSTATPPAVLESFFANVDGVEFEETILGSSENQGFINIIASENASFPSIGLMMPDTIPVGTYTFTQVTGTGATAGYNTGTTINDLYGAATGTGNLTITEHDKTAKTIAGTFSFAATPGFGNTSSNSYDVTDGSFVVNY